MKHTWTIAALLLTSIVPPRDPAVKVGQGIQPQAAVDSDGNVYVVYIKGGNVVVSISTDRSKTFGEPVTAFDAGGAVKGGKQRGPRIGVDAKKILYVTVPHENNIRLVASADAGKTWTKPLRVNNPPGNSKEGLHWIAVPPNGDVHISWIDCREGKGQDLFYARATEGGTKVGPNVKIADDVCACCAPGVAADEKGTTSIVVREGGQKSSREILLSRSTDSGKSFSKPSRVNKTPTNIKG